MTYKKFNMAGWWTFALSASFLVVECNGKAVKIGPIELVKL